MNALMREVEFDIDGESAMSVTAATAKLAVRVRSVSYETEDILRFELVDPAGGELPPFSAGAHLDVHVAEGYCGTCLTPFLRRALGVARRRRVKYTMTTGAASAPREMPEAPPPPRAEPS